MVEFEAILDAPISARYHREAVEQIVQCVEEGIYCAVLGPRLCGKTLLLQFIERNLAGLFGWTCAYIDLLDLRSTTQQVFFADLARLTAERLSQVTGILLPLPEEAVASSAVYRAFLSDCLERVQRDLVLIIDPLDALPTDLVQALLTSLRAAYMDQQSQEYRTKIVVSGALSLATLAAGESSPFRGIARRVFVGNLSKSASQALTLDYLAEYGVSATRHALQKILQAASGDVYLIRKISQRCAELVLSKPYNLLRARDVTQIVDRFLRTEVFQYAPLVEAVRLIEEDPDLLRCVLYLMDHESTPRSILPLPLSPDLDPLYLTGVVERLEGDRYRLQNSIYHRFLAQHFTPGRVGHILAMLGRWDSAIDYLEASMQQGTLQSRFDLLTATINSMYAAQDLAQAVHFLRRGLSAAFRVSNSQVWLNLPQEKLLRLIGMMDINSLNGQVANMQIPLNADLLETRAYRSKVPLRGHESEGGVVRAIPLMIPGVPPIGVVTIFEDLLDDVFYEQRERDLQLVGFLNQAARALQTVGLRRQELTLAGRVQASLLPDALPEVRGWQVAATWKPAKETSGDFYDFIALPDGKIGLVIADVVDKGMGAALLMALSRTLIRTYAVDHHRHPEHLLRVTNQRILADMSTGLFVTLFYGVLDPASGVLTYCNAGHPPPFIIQPGEDEAVEALRNTGMPLGVSNETDWQTMTAVVPPGAVLLLYTDGLLDAQNQDGLFFGEGQVLNSIRSQIGSPVQVIQDELLTRVYAFTGSGPQGDDITLITLLREY